MTSHCTESSPPPASTDQWEDFRRWRRDNFPLPERHPPPPHRTADRAFMASAFVKDGAPSTLEAWFHRLLDDRAASVVEDCKAMVEKTADASHANLETVVARMVVEVIARLQQEGNRKWR